MLSSAGPARSPIKFGSPAVRGALYSAPLIVVLVAFFLFPLATMASRSLASESGIGLANYLTILREGRYFDAFLFTSLLAVLSTAAALLLCVPAAYYLEQRKTPARRLASVALSLPLSLPGIVIGFFIILGFGRTGVVTDLIKGVTGWRNPQLAYTFWGLLFGYIYFQIPRVILVLRGAISHVDKDALSVARTLGLAPAAVFVRVIVPTLRPSILSASTLSLATAYGAFGTAATLSRGIRVIPLEIAALFTERFQPDKAAALSILLGIVTVSLMVVLGRAQGRGS